MHVHLPICYTQDWYSLRKVYIFTNTYIMEYFAMYILTKYSLRIDILEHKPCTCVHSFHCWNFSYENTVFNFNCSLLFSVLHLINKGFYALLQLLLSFPLWCRGTILFCIFFAMTCVIIIMLQE